MKNQFKLILVLLVLIIIPMISAVPTIIQNNTGDLTFYYEIRGSNWYGQTFAIDNNNYSLSYIDLSFEKYGSPNCLMNISIRNSSLTGNDLSFNYTINTTSIPISFGWFKIIMPNYTLNRSTNYSIVVGMNNGCGDTNNFIKWHSTGNNYIGGKKYSSIDNGTIWTVSSSTDFRFDLYGILLAPDIIYPTFSNFWDNNGTIYGSGTGIFNATVVNTNGTVFLEVDNTIEKAWNTNGNNYIANHTFLKNGTYLYRWYSYGNGNNNNYNKSSDFYFTINNTLDSSLSINVINYLANINVVKNSLFSVTFNITCLSGTCKNFNIGLDPELINYTDETITATSLYNGIPTYTKFALPEESNIIIEFKDEPIIIYKESIENNNLYTFFGTTKILTNLMVSNKRNNLEKSQQDFIKIIENKFNKDIEIKNSYNNLMNGIAIKVKTSDINYIKKLSNVKRVYEDNEVHILLQDAVSLINATKVWQQQNSSGSNITGAGIKVAVIDTGIAYNHTDFESSCTTSTFTSGFCNKTIYGWDYVNKDNDPYDDNGHGTHVAGIIGANGIIKGVAPNVTLLAYKVLNADGSGYSSDIISAIENATLEGANIISMSLGGSGYADSVYSSVIKNAVDNNVVVVVASGNSGPNYNTINSPGSDINALTVGASNKSDSIAYFSSRGTAFYSNGSVSGIKPEVLAPGVDINSTVPIGICEQCSNSGYKVLSGTSMATPMISGVVALIKQAHPTWNATEIKSAITNPSIDLGYDIWTQGSGRVDAFNSYNSTSVAVPNNFYINIPITSETYPYLLRQVINVKNLINSQLNYTVNTNFDYSSIGLVGLTLNDLSINGGDNGNINFTLTITNQYLKVGYYNSTLNIISSDGKNFKVPYMIHVTSEDNSKGLISDIIGDTPFYTNESNPRTLNLGTGNSELVTFWVNATGNIGNTYNFYGFVDNGLTINNSNSWNVTIVGESSSISSFWDNNGTIYGSGTGIFNATVVNTNFNVGINFNGINYTSISDNWVDSPYLYWITSPVHHNGNDFVASIWFKTTDNIYPKSLIWQANHFYIYLLSNNSAYFNIQNLIWDFWGENYTKYKQSSNISSTFDYNINDGEWHNIIGKWDNINGNISIWLDGNITNSSKLSTINKTIWVSSTIILGDNSNISMDEVRIYENGLAVTGWANISDMKIDLTDSDIKNIYNSGRIKNLTLLPDINNMMAWLSMDEGYATTIYNNAPKINTKYTEEFYTPFMYPGFNSTWGKSIQKYVTYIPIESPTTITTYPYYWWTYNYLKSSSQAENNIDNGTYNKSDTYYYTTLGNPDLIYPSFTTYQDNSGINSEEIAMFNVTVYDTNGDVTLTINGNNYQASNLIGNIYNISINNLAPNNYSYYWNAKGSGLNHNSINSDTKYFYIFGEREYEKFNPSLFGAGLINKTYWQGQQFIIGNTNTNEDFNLTNISVYIFRTGNPSYNISMELRSYDYLTNLANSTNNITEIDIPLYPSGDLKYFNFNNYPIKSDGNYSFIIKGDGGNSTDYLRVGYGNSEGYSGGNLSRSYDLGNTWTTINNYNLNFVIRGISSLYVTSNDGTLDIYSPTFTNLRNFNHLVNTSFSNSIIALDYSGIDTYSLNDTSIFQIDNNGLITNKTNLSSIEKYWLNISVNDTLNNLASGIFYINIVNLPIVNQNSSIQGICTQGGITFTDAMSLVGIILTILLIGSVIAILIGVFTNNIDLDKIKQNIELDKVLIGVMIIGLTGLILTTMAYVLINGFCGLT